MPRSSPKAAETVIVIDHHPDTRAFGDVLVHEPTAAATGQIVWNLVKEFDNPPSADVAQCCYVGLLTDTGRFCYDNTTADAFRAAAEMVDAGADPAEIAVYVYQSRSAASLAIENRAMSRLTVANGGRVAYAWVNDADFEEIGALPEEAESLPDAVRVVEGRRRGDPAAPGRWRGAGQPALQDRFRRLRSRAALRRRRSSTPRRASRSAARSSSSFRSSSR